MTKIRLQSQPPVDPVALHAPGENVVDAECLGDLPSAAREPLVLEHIGTRHHVQHSERRELLGDRDRDVRSDELERIGPVEVIERKHRWEID